MRTLELTFTTVAKLLRSVNISAMQSTRVLKSVNYHAALLAESQCAGSMIAVSQHCGNVSGLSRSQHGSSRSGFCERCRPGIRNNVLASFVDRETFRRKVCQRSLSEGGHAAAARGPTKCFDIIDSAAYVLTVIGTARKGFIICLYLSGFAMAPMQCKARSASTSGASLSNLNRG